MLEDGEREDEWIIQNFAAETCTQLHSLLFEDSGNHHDDTRLIFNTKLTP